MRKKVCSITTLQIHFVYGLLIKCILAFDEMLVVYYYDEGRRSGGGT